MMMKLINVKMAATENRLESMEEDMPDILGFPGLSEVEASAAAETRVARRVGRRQWRRARRCRA
jgi:hypothetical protein